MSDLLYEVLVGHIVPVVVVRDAAQAAGLAEALVAADLPGSGGDVAYGSRR